MSGLVLAQNTIDLTINGTSTFNPLNDMTIGSLVSGIIIAVLVISSLVFFFMLVIGGIKWITSGGDKTKTEGARSQITAALVGLAIVFSAWALVLLLETLFDVNLLDLEFQSFV